MPSRSSRSRPHSFTCCSEPLGSATRAVAIAAATLTTVSAVELDYDRFLVDQLVRPMANLYRVTPLAAGEAPAGPPIAYVRQRKLAIKEDIRFYADEGETRELFRIKARSVLDMGSSRYDVFVGE